MKSLLMTTVAVMLFVASNFAFAQTLPDCIEPGGNCGPWQDRQVEFTISEGCRVLVDFQIRFCDGVAQFKIRKWTKIPDAFEQSNCDLFSARTLKEIIMVKLLEDQYAIAVPLCRNGSAVLAEIFTGTCVYEKVCTYTYPGPPIVTCDPTRSPQNLPPGSQFDFPSYIPCGKICCKTTFEICKSTGEEVATYTLIKKLGTESLGQCDSPPAGATKPCIDICN